MNENTLVNNYKKRHEIFKSLMATEIHTKTKTHWEILRELKMLEVEGKLRVYTPEDK